MSATEDVPAGEDAPLLDTMDMVVLTLLVAGLVYYLVQRFGSSSSSATASSSASAASAAVMEVEDDIAAKMEKSGKNLVVFYGSQTGTAEEFAYRLAKESRRYGLKALAADLQDYDVEQFSKLSEIENNLAIFCMATYGEGDPTDNAQDFHDFLKRYEEDGDTILENVNFAVFGLGNTTYEHYNAVAKLTDSCLEKLGGKRVYELGLGDDDGNLEEDFVTWKEGLWPAVCKHFGLDPNNIVDQGRQYELVELTDVSPDRIFTGEPLTLKSYLRQRKPFDAKNPFMSPVAVNRELYKGDRRSCLHIELDITGSGIRYAAGDHVAIFPTNNAALVEALGKRLQLNLDQVFRMKATDEFSKKQSPFPTPCTYRTALTHYVDITSPPNVDVIKELIEHAADAKDKAFLKDLVGPDGKHKFIKFTSDEQRDILQFLQDVPSLKPPMDVLLEYLPRLQPRFYSISSSPKMHPNHVHATAAVVRYETPLGRKAEGVCTTFLEKQLPADGAKVPIYVRQSTFRLPPRPATPVVMIGPGTGLAPFRGFIQERASLLEKGKELGETVLFFGCQKRAENFLYEEEILEYQKKGAISHLFLAFSRDQANKVYVQHKLQENGEFVYELLTKKSGYLYICGDARNMARDVHKALVEMAVKFGGKTEEEGQAWLKNLSAARRFQQDVWS